MIQIGTTKVSQIALARTSCLRFLIARLDNGFLVEFLVADLVAM